MWGRSAQSSEATESPKSEAKRPHTRFGSQEFARRELPRGWSGRKLSFDGRHDRKKRCRIRTRGPGRKSRAPPRRERAADRTGGPGASLRRGRLGLGPMAVLGEAARRGRGGYATARRGRRERRSRFRGARLRRRYPWLRRQKSTESRAYLRRGRRQRVV